MKICTQEFIRVENRGGPPSHSGVLPPNGERGGGEENGKYPSSPYRLARRYILPLAYYAIGSVRTKRTLALRTGRARALGSREGGNEKKKRKRREGVVFHLGGLALL